MIHGITLYKINNANWVQRHAAEGEIKMGKILENKLLKKESLMSKAFDLFVKNGINKTSISDIVNEAGVAKGTFYLYFKDKYDIHNKIIKHKSSEIFSKALDELKTQDISEFDDRVIFVIDSIINQLSKNKSLLKLIAKNLSWGIFKSVLIIDDNTDDINFMQVYNEMILGSDIEFEEPEIMLFMIVELVSSTCYSSILYSEPRDINELKPYLYKSVRNIIDSHKITKDTSK